MTQKIINQTAKNIMTSALTSHIRNYN